MATKYPLHGSCLCQGVKIQVLDKKVEKTPNIICYCKDCSKAAGGTNQWMAIFKPEDVKFEDPNEYIKSTTITETDSGHPKVRFFCGNCGSTLYSKVHSTGENILFRVSLLDEVPSEFYPDLFSYEQNSLAFEKNK